MRITARGLNRSTLARQLLLRREALDASEGVRRVVALQAQQPASPYVALWNRLAGFDPAGLDAAFTDHRVVKATMMRLTLHAVHADDHPAFREAMHPVVRAARLGGRFTASGLTAQDADALVPRLLEFADRPRTTAECEAWLGEQLGAPPKAGAWWGLRQYAPLLHAPTASPWSFGHRPSYIAPRTGSPRTDPEASAASLRTLVLRYLSGFGPASVADVAQFAMVTRAGARAALADLAEGLERLAGPEGEELFDLPGAPRPDGAEPAPPRLMAMWDSVLLAYADRGRVLPETYRRTVIRANGDVLPTLLVDGYVAGVWRPVAGGVEATAFHPLPDEVWEGLAAEARSLVGFLADREPEVYRRYGHWWSRLPDATVRLLPGS
ncbi:winged helix DNA-binding domain-containing protein [Streptomyces sp. SID14515]|uniref:winged helix DNA-binding domain-containing protein n=1 Tax=Streptomyces sp. SID14515 TaxID=2706074 RepID=UPI0013C9884A|nr:winged helix DNA-binding domain-containing protein [Streptomyces sp. SID14515]NEB41537.1 winged helix DNA-binding domain-containing protein [Streptomyces sp. SID14515]